MNFTPREAQSCGNCDAFKPNAAVNPRSGEARQGWCGAAPPIAMSVIVNTLKGQQSGIQGVWPTTGADQWCRCWQPEGDNGDGSH